MRKELKLKLPPEVAFDEKTLVDTLKKKLNIKASEPLFYLKKRQSIDARKRKVVVNLSIEIDTQSEILLELGFKKNYPDVSKAPKALIVGSGPAGLFAALRLIELGIKPILLERGSDVRKRRRDLAAINKHHLVNGESNYCFGEGGAGTYSDGKLYTRAKKRGDVLRTLEILVAHGASSQILVDNHPHIGTNKLPQVVQNLRESIRAAGGEVHFDTKVTDFIISREAIKGVIDQSGKEYLAEGVILATGHSARDIFELLNKRKIEIEAKPFAMGVRVEHQQTFVDTCQYNSNDKGLLPPASYSLVAQTKYKEQEKGVFSFCMCPGGFIVPSATQADELVVNGMSPSRRNSKYANSGVVVSVNEANWQKYAKKGPLAALELQRELEKKAWDMAKQLSPALPHSQIAPAQLMTDFWKKRTSKSLNNTSYQPGLASLDMNEILPDYISIPLQQGLKYFDKRMKGYRHGQLIGIESRTSSPVRIPRDRVSLEHVRISRLFPCGEGAGYAGGIISAAMDGEKSAQALYAKISSGGQL